MRYLYLLKLLFIKRLHLWTHTTLEEINEEWQHITNENIKQLDFKILAIDNYTVIVEWYLEQNFEVYDGIYEIKFNENLECIYFKSWEMKDISN